MADNLASNPFAALFSSLETAKAFTDAVADLRPEKGPAVGGIENGKTILPNILYVNPTFPLSFKSSIVQSLVA